jgi:hypothetical protein
VAKEQPTVPPHPLADLPENLSAQVIFVNQFASQIARNVPTSIGLAPRLQFTSQRIAERNQILK